NGGVYPVWSLNRRELFFRDPENQIMVAAYAADGDSFLADQPRRWGEKKFANNGAMQPFGIAPDGRIAVPLSAEGPEAQRPKNHVVFLLNFFDEIQQRTRAGFR